MRFLIYEFPTFGGTRWGWKVVDSNGNDGLGVAPLEDEEAARTNLTETLEVFGVDPAGVTIDVEPVEGETKP